MPGRGKTSTAVFQDLEVNPEGQHTAVIPSSAASSQCCGSLSKNSSCDALQRARLAMSLKCFPLLPRSKCCKGRRFDKGCPRNRKAFRQALAQVGS
eukprot:Skav204222  [mRNA]  locus=scaffold1550:67334:70842:+ [translate_table: standard]